MEASNGNSFNLLPPGLRFCPTDEDLVLHFLYHKASLSPTHTNLSSSIIPHLQLHLYNPWQFHGKALSNGDIHYFFSKVGESRATESGYWKDVLMDEPILSSGNGDEVGIKKYHIFFVGEEDDAIQTSWVMQEYRINSYLLNTHAQSQHNKLSQTKSEFGLWVLCRVFEAKDNSGRSMFSYEEEDDNDNESELSYLDEMYLTLDDI